MRNRFIQIIAFSGLGVLVYLYLYGWNYNSDSATIQIAGWLICLGVVNLFGLLLDLLSQGLEALLPWRKYLISRLFLQMILGFVIAFGLIVGLMTGIAFVQSPQNFAISTLQEDMNVMVKLGIVGVISSVIFTFVDMAFSTYQEYTHGQIERVASQRRQLELQFEALKNQLSPHYLFNSLNTISSLISTQTTDAETFIRRLVQTYQYILATRNRQLATLEEEVEFVKAYNYLLRVRFDEALRIDIDLPEYVLGRQLPPLSLQMLVENAVKHNVISDEEPLLIRIHLDRDNNLHVSNNVTQTPEETTSFKVGLDNIKRRYAYFTERNVKVMENERFEVILPLLQNINPTLV
ncbi:MAG TPA: hypothetical protein DCE41_27265 [Cytophagales bacterium]|nr:hypothetical protein [Cytophagales bacterium]HAA21948.1 hypothetical protein [Cytophagales bacterium]HAP61356.1 hypothetical protein [Cytophagales bacterium]